MKKLFLIFSLLLMSVLFFDVALAGNVRYRDNIKPPQLQVEIGGFNFGEDVTQSGNVTTDWISKYISVIYRYGIGAAAILATVMIMFGGFLWLTSAGSPDRIGKAKDYITSAMFGLLLALFSFIILQAVNPRLVTLDGATVLTPATLEVGEVYGTEGFQVLTEGTTLGNTFDVTDPVSWLFDNPNEGELQELLDDYNAWNQTNNPDAGPIGIRNPNTEEVDVYGYGEGIYISTFEVDGTPDFFRFIRENGTAVSQVGDTWNNFWNFNENTEANNLSYWHGNAVYTYNPSTGNWNAMMGDVNALQFLVEGGNWWL